MQNFIGESLFLVERQETRKRSLIVTYCSGPDLRYRGFLSFSFRPYLLSTLFNLLICFFSLYVHINTYIYIYISTFASLSSIRTPFRLDDFLFEPRYSQGSFLAFEIAVSIRNVMERGVSFSSRLLLSPFGGFRAMQHVSLPKVPSNAIESWYFKEIYDRSLWNANKRMRSFFSFLLFLPFFSFFVFGHDQHSRRTRNFCTSKFANVSRDLNQKSNSVHGTF